MKAGSFALRNTKEILRDRLNLIFGIGFPVVVLVLLTAIQSNIPVELFRLDSLAPGVAVFGLSFISLFSGLTIAKDRGSSFMLRLFVSPMTAKDYILGYTVPLLPMALAQSIVCFAVALMLGMEFRIQIFLVILILLPAAVLFIAIGLLCGSLFTDKQVGGVCGALLTNLTAWLSGTWFDLKLVGGGFQAVADCLPFAHAVNAGRFAMAGEYGKVMPEFIWVMGYAAVFYLLAVIVFTRKMKSDAQ